MVLTAIFQGETGFMNKGNVAMKSPIAVETQAGKEYKWCACGLTKTEPFCDQSHKGTEWHPIKFAPTESGTTYFCGCKQTDNQPCCDGTHSRL